MPEFQYAPCWINFSAVSGDGFSINLCEGKMYPYAGLGEVGITPMVTIFDKLAAISNAFFISALNFEKLPT